MTLNLSVKNLLSVICLCLIVMSAAAQKEVRIKKKDRRRDVLIETSMGEMVIRLSDSTPLHRDNFIRLVKQHYFDSILFHRVIKNFMIQAGDPNSKGAKSGQPLGNGGPKYTVPAEIRPTLFHKKGVIAAAREGDNVNPQKASSGSQFYLTQGKVFTRGALDSMEIKRPDRLFSEAQKQAYTTIGGVPHLDKNYTVFGEVVKGLEVIDQIAAVATSKDIDRDRPLTDVMIVHAKLIKRRN